MAEVVLSDADPAGNVSSLDGLRGFAVSIVLLHHLAYVYPPQLLPANVFSRSLAFAVHNGWLGVDIFFVLSGYLITTTLLRTRKALNFYKGFYVRRALRIWPLHIAVLLFVFHLSGWAEYRHAPLWVKGAYWLGLSNYYSAFFPAALPIISLFWSLAIEEQFYLVWPTLVRRLRPAGLMKVLSWAFLLELLLRATPWSRHSNLDVPYRLTPLHWDGLVLGSMLAVCVTQKYLTRRNAPVLLATAGIAAPVSLVLLRHGAQVYCTPVIAFTSAALIGFLVLGTRTDTLSKFLSLPTLRLLGRYSYFMYITQAVFFQILSRRVWSHIWYRFDNARTLGYVVPTIGSFVVLFYLGHLSWAFVEGPLNRLKSRFPYQYAPVPLAGSGSQRHENPMASSAFSSTGQATLAVRLDEEPLSRA